jgi:hypothetical protein
MARTRKLNHPISVYQIDDCTYQVLGKPSGEMWLVAMISPREREPKPQELYAQTLVASGTLVWREGDGDLPEQYRI